MQISSSTALNNLLDSPFRLKLYFLKSLPMAFLAGLRVVSYDANHASVSLPFKYWTKNPFRSIYFACQAMAAEFSTAILFLQELATHEADVSLLVIQLESTFLKKADDIVTFRCSEAAHLGDVIKECINSGEPRKTTLESVGTDAQGHTIAEFKITWSFKDRS